MRSHDLNRLLDEPGADDNGLPLLKISSSATGARDGPWGDPSLPVAMIEAIIAMGFAQIGNFGDSLSRVVLLLAELSHSTRWALVRGF